MCAYVSGYACVHEQITDKAVEVNGVIYAKFLEMLCLGNTKPDVITIINSNILFSFARITLLGQRNDFKALSLILAY